MLHLVTQLWCAAGVNLSGGKTRDGGSIVGASVFYSDVSVPESPKKKVGGQSSVEKLDQELKVQPHFCSPRRFTEVTKPAYLPVQLCCSQDQQKEHRQQDELSSLVWICTSTKSTTKAIVIDANQPGNILDSFLVCNSHVLCVTSVPGE